jgi:hypothetical protein
VSAWNQTLPSEDAYLLEQQKISAKHAAEWKELADFAFAEAGKATDSNVRDSWIADATFDTNQALNCNVDARNFGEGVGRN